MKRILIFSGTTEGRQLADILDASGICADVCVATEYGHEVMTEGQYRNIYTGRLTEEEMKEKALELLNDKQKLALFGHEARLNAEDYSYDSVKEKWLSIINDILN